MKIKKLLLILLLMVSMIMGSVGEVFAANEYLTWGPGTLYKYNASLPNVSIYTVATTSSVQIKMVRPASPDSYMTAYMYLDGGWNTGGTQIEDFVIPFDSPPVAYYTKLPARTPDTYRKVVLTLYSFGVFNGGGGSGLRSAQEIVLNTYTDAMIPIGVSFPTIGTTSTKLSWNNQSNPSNTSYTLQRSLNGTNWVDVTTQAGMYEYTDTGLTQNTKYYYRIRVNEKRGTYKYSSISWIETATDPAVAAAKAAQSAAESTKSFAEEAKLAAQNSETKASEAVELIKKLETSPKVTSIRVIKGVPFLKLIYGSACNGRFENSEKNILVKTVDNEYSIIEGTIDNPSIGEKTGFGYYVLNTGIAKILFEVINPPKLSDAAVTFK